MKSWKLVKKEVLHTDFWNSVIKNTYKMPNGKINQAYITLECRDVAAACAITEDKKVVLIREYKQGLEKMFIQLPAGYVDDNEKPIDAAKRELEEETGYVSQKWVKLGTLQNAPGKAKMAIHGFLALNAKKQKGQKLDENEWIKVMPVKLEKAFKMIEQGEIYGSEAAALILMAARRLK